MPSQPWLGAAALLAAICSGPAYAQPQWQPVPQSQTKTGSPATPGWKPLTPAGSGAAQPSQPSAPQWKLLPAPAPGSGPAPVIWQPVAPGEQQASPPPTSQTPQRQGPPRQPPTSQQEAQSLLRNLPLSWADYPPLLRLGMLPTASVLESSDFQITIGQVSPFST